MYIRLTQTANVTAAAVTYYIRPPNTNRQMRMATFTTDIVAKGFFALTMVTETASASKAIEGLLREPRLYEDFLLVSDYSADANLSLKSSSGIVLAVPISKEEATSGEIIEKAIQKALQEARYLSLVINKVIMILRDKSILYFVS